MPQNSCDKMNSTTEMLEKRREIVEIDQALAAEKEEFMMKMESLQLRIEELKIKECTLKESLLKFDRFLKENDIKRTRAVKKAIIEKEQIKLKDREITRLQHELESMKQRRQIVMTNVTKSKIYRDYMDKVCASCEVFEEIEEIIGRYNTLAATREDLIKQNQTNQETIENLFKNLTSYVQAKNNEILHCNNTLATLQTLLEKAQGNSTKSRREWTSSEYCAEQKSLTYGRLKMAIYNLYTTTCRKIDGLSHSQVDDFKRQLDTVQTYVDDLKHIVYE